jgi:oligopeptidase B
MNTAPKAKKKLKKLKIHGDLRTDNYYWLRERENPEVKAYLEAENAYTREVLAPTEKLQQELYEEMRGRIKETDMSVPYLDRGYWYYVRFETGMEHPIYCRKKDVENALEEIILNANERAKGFEFYKVSGLTVSPDNRLLAFGEDTLGRWIFTLRIKNLETGELLPDILENTESDYAWAADSLTLLYTTKDETLRAHRVWMHVCKLPQHKDILVYEEDDEAFSVSVASSKSEAFLFIESSSYTCTEWQYAPADLQHPFQIFDARRAHIEYGLEHTADTFYVLTNENAENFRLLSCPVTDIRLRLEIMPHRPDTLLEDIEVFKDFLVLEERHIGQPQIRIIRLADGDIHLIRFDEPAHTVYCQANPEFNTPLLRIGYTSLTRPNTVYDYRMDTRELILLKELEVVGGHHPEDYLAERIIATARDGAQIPMSLVRHKLTPTDGSAPLLLYGYGSYGHIVDPSFSITRLSLLNRGFIFAIAHIRGGEMLGRHWYENGKWLNKMNTFYDFIDCARYLCDHNYTKSEKLFCMGGSAGGLLVGAVLNMRPDLFKGAIAQVPFVDVLTTMLDESIPLTTAEYDEWGDPNDPTYYHYMKKYSPYDNVSPKDYPHLLVTAGFHDSQVQYWEPAKWVAKMRDIKTDNHLLLLQTQMEAGHHGASGRFEGLREIAIEFAFLLFVHQMGD